MEQLHFEYPYVFLLFGVYFFITLFFEQKQQSYAIANLLHRVPAQKKRVSLRQALKYITFLCATIALASPIIIQHPIDKKNHKLNIVLGLDTSGSMSLKGLNELDYNQTRLNVVQNVVKDFIQKREKDRIGLVIFGDRSSIVLPLSDDKEALKSVIDKISIGLVGKSTALRDSIVNATMLLKKSFSSSKIIILLSDGDDTASQTPLEIVLKIAKKYKIKIYTIAIGESNNNLLQLLATQSGGRSFKATNKKNLSKVYESITALEAATHNTNRVEFIRYYFTYPLFVALFFALLLAFLARESEVV